MPLDAAKIKEYRDLIASKSREDALPYIAALKPFTIVPIVYSILQDGIEITKNLPELAETHAFFIETEVVIGDLKRRLEAYEDAGIFRILKLLTILNGLTKERVAGDLHSLIENIKKVQVVDSSVDLFQEAAIWLEGWYRHTKFAYKKNQIDQETQEPLKDAAGKYLIIDSEDKHFRTKTGFAQYAVALHYHEAAKILENKLDAFKAENRVEVRHESGRAIISVTIDSANEELIERIKQAMKAACRDQQENVKEKEILPQLAALKKTKEEIEKNWCGVFGQADTDWKRDSESIDKFMRRFRVYGLTDEQTSMFAAELGNLKSLINGNIDSYVNNSFSLFGFAWDRVHTPIAQNAKKEISTAKSPAELIETLYGLRQKLIKDNSTTLLPKINDALLNVVDVLSMPFASVNVRSAAPSLSMH